MCVSVSILLAVNIFNSRLHSKHDYFKKYCLKKYQRSRSCIKISKSQLPKKSDLRWADELSVVMIAAEEGVPQIAILLIAASPAVDARNPLEKTSLMMVALAEYSNYTVDGCQKVIFTLKRDLDVNVLGSQDRFCIVDCFRIAGEQVLLKLDNLVLKKIVLFVQNDAGNAGQLPFALFSKKC